MTGNLATRPAALRVPPAVRTAAIGAAVWALAFAGLNVWVQVTAMRGHPALRDYVGGLALLNGIAVVMKVTGAAVVLRAVAPLSARTARHVTVIATTAAVTLTMWGGAALAVLVADGSITADTPLAGGAVHVVGWTYPAFFLVGALVFGVPAWWAARHCAHRWRWLIGAGMLGPLAVMGTLGTVGVVEPAGAVAAGLTCSSAPAATRSVVRRPQPGRRPRSEARRRAPGRGGRPE